MSYNGKRREVSNGLSGRDFGLVQLAGRMQEIFNKKLQKLDLVSAKMNKQLEALDERMTLLEFRSGMRPRTQSPSVLKSCLAKLETLGELDASSKLSALRKLDALSSGTLH